MISPNRLEWFRVNVDHGKKLSAKLGEELLDEIDRLQSALSVCEHEKEVVADELKTLKDRNFARGMV